MAVGESAGAVFVTIDGDVSPLAAKLAQAEAASKAAGQAVASGFSSGAGAVDGLALATDAAADSQARFAVVTEATSRALGHEVTQIQAVSGTLRTLEGNQGIRAAERFLTMIPGLAPALQAAFPVIGLLALGEVIDRTAEKFIKIKEAEEAATKAAQESDTALERDLGNIERVNVQLQTMQFGAAAGKKLEGFYTKAAADRDLDQVHALNLEVQDMEKRASGFHLTDLIPKYGAEIRQKEQADIAEKQSQQQKLQAESETKATNAKLQGAEAVQKSEQQSGALAVKRIEAQEQASVSAAKISKQQYDSEIDLEHSAQQQRIAGIDSEYARVVAAGNEEIRFEKAKEDEIAGYALATRDRTISEIAAKAGAESAGKSAPEQALIRTGAQSDTQKAKDEYAQAVGKAGLDVQKSQADATLKLVELNQKLAQTLDNEVRAGWEKVEAAAHKTTEESIAATTKDLEIKQRVAEIQAKSAGDVKVLQIKAQEIELERQYGLAVNHSGEEEVANARQMASLHSQERAAKLASIQSELQAAQAEDSSVRDQTKIAELESQIAVLKQQGADADAQDAAHIDQMNQKLTQTLTLQQQITNAKNAAAATLQSNQRNIGTKLGEDIGNLPKDVGDDIGSSISGALLERHPGKSIGQEMSKALKTSLEGEARKLLGDAISAEFQEVFANLKHRISPTVPQGSGGAVGAPTGGGGVTSGATIPAGLPGAGTPIYGNNVPPPSNSDSAMAAQMTQMNASLRQLVSIETQCECNQPAERLLAQMLATSQSQSGTLDKILATDLTSLSIQAAQLIIDTLLYFKPSVLGTTFASGTDSAPGGMALVGEKGPEIVNLPRGSQVIPNHAIHKYADGTPGYSSSTHYKSTSFQTGSTELHFHAHGMNNPDKFIDHVMRKLPETLKRRSPIFSPLSH